MKKDQCVKLNNKGLSLVELIIAISIGIIISGSIAALITFALRTYRNESVNTAMQYELQSNINLIMDEIMASSVFVVVQNDDVDLTDTDKGAYTKYALFGNTNADITVGGSPAKGFKGVILVSSDKDSDNKFKIYMNRIEETYSATSLTDYASSKASAVTGDQYLLGESATQFVIQPDPNSRFDAENSTYTNPVEVKIELQFEDKGWGDKNYSKHVNDITYMRNKSTESVFVMNPGDSDYTEYKLAEKEK